VDVGGKKGEGSTPSGGNSQADQGANRGGGGGKIH